MKVESRTIDQVTQPHLHHHGGAGAEQANSALGTEELQKKISTFSCVKNSHLAQAQLQEVGMAEINRAGKVSLSI